MVSIVRHLGNRLDLIRCLVVGFRAELSRFFHREVSQL